MGKRRHRRISNRREIGGMPIWVAVVAGVGTLGLFGGAAAVALTRSDDVPAAATSVRPVPTVSATPDSKRVEGETLNITFLGTSLGSGYFASSEEKTYKALITAKLGEVGPVQVFPVPRERMEPGAPTVLTTYDPLKVAPDQDIIFMELGTNDGGNSSGQEFRDRYKYMVQTMRASSPDALFICFGPWQQDGGGIQQIISEVCPGRFVPLEKLFQVESFHGPEGRETPYGPGDLFHPNDDGMAAIADAAIKVLWDYTLPPGASRSS